MFQFPENYWFKPTQSIEPFIPVFLILAAVLLLVWMINLIYQQYLVFWKTKQAWRKFMGLARKKGLNQRETVALYRLLRDHAVHDYHLVLSNQTEFENLVHPLPPHCSPALRHKIDSIHRKLFLVPTSSPSHWTSTSQLPLGSRLLMINPLHKDTVFEGHLIEKDSTGLVVELMPEQHPFLPVKNGTLLCVHCLREGQTIHFFTTVETLLSKEKIMVVLAHTSHLTTGPSIEMPHPHHEKTASSSFRFSLPFPRPKAKLNL
jgi:hypothetical protein